MWTRKSHGTSLGVCLWFGAGGSGSVLVLGRGSPLFLSFLVIISSLEKVLRRKTSRHGIHVSSVVSFRCSDLSEKGKILNPLIPVPSLFTVQGFET